MMQTVQEWNRRPVRWPDEIALMPRSELFAWFEELADGEAQALRTGQPLPVEDVWTQLAVQARLVAEVSASRWLLVTGLLRNGAASSWWEIAKAEGNDNPEAMQAEYLKWVTTQVDLYQQGIPGLTDEAAIELRDLAHALALVDTTAT